MEIGGPRGGARRMGQALRYTSSMVAIVARTIQPVLDTEIGNAQHDYCCWCLVPVPTNEWQVRTRKNKWYERANERTNIHLIYRKFIFHLNVTFNFPFFFSLSSVHSLLFDECMEAPTHTHTHRHTLTMDARYNYAGVATLIPTTLN